ncbi:MAG: hypothetical protein GX595_10390 [Lentisphaerae bacterium]|nr:hypothetical protein [Lentisphaerota bacterium]
MASTADPQSVHEESVVAAASRLPAWVAALAAVAALCMATQLRFPVLGGRLGVSDVAMGLAFLGLLWDQFRRGVTYRYPRLLALALVLLFVASLAARGGTGAASEGIQRFQQLFCGFLVWALLLRERPTWAGLALTAMLALNVLVAALQGRTHGFAAVLPPADVMALPWGIGGAFTGLFRSRVSLSLFLGGGLLLAQPLWSTWAGTSWWRRGVTGLGTVLVLVTIPHGYLLLSTALLLVVASLLRQAGGLSRTVVVLAVALAVLAGLGRLPALAGTLLPVKPGTAELKSCHVDALAALRLAARRPWTGVGLGTYQKYIGRAYGELPNPNVNDIETDTQSGLGILLSTAGYPAGLALILVLIVGLTGAIERFLSAGRRDAWALAGATALAFYLGALLISDPFVRGPAWFLTLALAAAFGAAEAATPGTFALGWRRVILAGVLAVVAAGLLVTLPSRDALSREASAARPRPARTEAAATPEAPAATNAVAAALAGTRNDFFRVINAAADAKTVTAPMERAPDGQSAKGTVLQILDGKGTPPEDGTPDMKYGGAAFELSVTAPVTCKIWVRAWWDGSCGNTVYVRLGEDGKPLTVGNDGTYNAWHWLEAPGTFALEPGTHTLFLLNREDGVRFDQILVTNDMEYFPQGIEEE